MNVSSQRSKTAYKGLAEEQERKKWRFENSVEREMERRKKKLQEKWDNEYYECLNKVRRQQRYFIWQETHPEEARKEERDRHMTLWLKCILPCVFFVGILSFIAFLVNDFILEGFHYSGFPDLTIQDPLFYDVFGQNGFFLEVIFPPIVSILMYHIMKSKLHKGSEGSHYPHIAYPTTIMCLALWGIELTSNFLLPTVSFLAVVLLCAGVPLWFFVAVVNGLSNSESDLPYKRIDFLDE